MFANAAHVVVGNQGTLCGRLLPGKRSGISILIKLIKYLRNTWKIYRAIISKGVLMSLREASSYHKVFRIINRSHCIMSNADSGQVRCRNENDFLAAATLRNKYLHVLLVVAVEQMKRCIM